MDILFENGTIRTLERNSPDAQALLVRNGRIAAVGGRTAVEDQTGIDVRRVDLAGRTLLPAFLDAHSHFTAVATSFYRCLWRAAPPGRTCRTGSGTTSGGSASLPGSG